MLQAPQTPPDLPGSPPSTTTTDLTQTSPPINGSASNSVNSINVSTKEVEEYMLVDWARAQECVKHFKEEVELCVEEMRRMLSFFSWSASEWDKHAVMYMVIFRTIFFELLVFFTFTLLTFHFAY